MGQVLYEPGKAQRHAYFPTTAIISLLHISSDGESTEVACVGEGSVLGTSLLLGSPSPTLHASVLIAGQGYRIEAEVIKGEFDRSDAVRHLLLRFTQTLVTQIAQTCVCNRHHSIEQQLCGWLLYMMDRLRDSEVVVTQDVLATMLGVRRESVTEAAGRLKAAGLIRYSRGHISVLDLAGLERRACECHAAVKKEYDRLLPLLPATRSASSHRGTSPASDPAALAYCTP